MGSLVNVRGELNRFSRRSVDAKSLALDPKPSDLFVGRRLPRDVECLAAEPVSVAKL